MKTISVSKLKKKMIVYDYFGSQNNLGKKFLGEVTSKVDYGNYIIGIYFYPLVGFRKTYKKRLVYMNLRRDVTVKTVNKKDLKLLLLGT